jgi:alpha-tubulin suppressor-like RCC1 family protein
MKRRCYEMRGFAATLALITVAMAAPACRDENRETASKRPRGVAPASRPASQPTRSADSIKALAGARTLTAGWSHSCAIDAKGKVLCWGFNGHGQLGLGVSANAVSPTAVVGLPPKIAATQLALGALHSCALLDDGAVYCWGYNKYGCVGDGSHEHRRRATRVELPPAKAIAAGGRHSCALLRDGTVRCWGKNSSGQLGEGSTDSASRPRQVAGGPAQVVAIAAGGAHSCALSQKGQVFCWGDNRGGRLGLGHESSAWRPGRVRFGDAKRVKPKVKRRRRRRRRRRRPQRVAPVRARPVELACGEHFSCVRFDDGAVRCWGAGPAVGRTKGVVQAKPASIEGLPKARRLAVGRRFGCVVDQTQKLHCWGANEKGQLGRGATSKPVAAGAATVLGAVRSVTLGGLHGCARFASDRVGCWGSNVYGQLGNGRRAPWEEPQLRP